MNNKQPTTWQELAARARRLLEAIKRAAADKQQGNGAAFLIFVLGIAACFLVAHIILLPYYDALRETLRIALGG